MEKLFGIVPIAAVVSEQNRPYCHGMSDNTPQDLDDDTASAAAETGAPEQEVCPSTSAGSVSDRSSAPETEPFDAPVRTDPSEGIDGLIVNLDGYEGPLDVLLDLARRQKVDLRKISMLALVEQYLAFIEAARQRSLDLAADYLVMASWLAFLKSKLLLPAPDESGEEPTADEMAARLAFQLQRLEAMRKAVDDLSGLPQLRVDIFPRGCPEGVRTLKAPLWQADLVDLLKAYTTQRVATVSREYKPPQPKVFSLEEARQRLARILGTIPDWSELQALSPVIAPLNEVDVPARSIMAGAFHAALEFAKEGRLDIRQTGHFQPIYIKQRDVAPAQSQSSPAAEIVSLSAHPQSGRLGSEPAGTGITDAMHQADAFDKKKLI